MTTKQHMILINLAVTLYQLSEQYENDREFAEVIDDLDILSRSADEIAAEIGEVVNND